MDSLPRTALAGVPLSILDRSRTRAGETEADTLRGTVQLAQQVEELGYHRFWVSEHHSVPGVVGSAPTVLAAAVAASTTRIRVGTGGVMLPNHQPLVVAEQFGVLESLFPGRIDMGLGRSVGFTNGIRRALGVEKDAAEDFTAQVRELLGYFTGTQQVHPHVHARPGEGLAVPPFVLAVGEGALLAASLGLPLVIAGVKGERGSSPSWIATAPASSPQPGPAARTSYWRPPWPLLPQRMRPGACCCLRHGPARTHAPVGCFPRCSRSPRYWDWR